MAAAPSFFVMQLQCRRYAQTSSWVGVGASLITVATFVGSAPGTILTVILGDALTGQSHPAAIILTVVLALIGVAGLAVDHRLPVKSVA